MCRNSWESALFSFTHDKVSQCIWLGDRKISSTWALKYRWRAKSSSLVSRGIHLKLWHTHIQSDMKCINLGLFHFYPSVGRNWEKLWQKNSWAKIRNGAIPFYSMHIPPPKKKKTTSPQLNWHTTCSLQKVFTVCVKLFGAICSSSVLYNLPLWTNSVECSVGTSLFIHRFISVR